MILCRHAGAALGIAFLIGCLSAATFGQAPPALLPVPDNLPEADRTVLLQQRADLTGRLAVLGARMAAHNAKSVTEGSPEEAALRREGDQLRADMQQFVAAAGAYNAAVAAKTRSQTEGASLVAESTKTLRAVKAPSPIPADQASIDFQLDKGGDEKSKWILLGTEAGAVGLRLSGKLAGNALLGVNALLVTGQTFIAMKNGADVYMVKQTEVYEQALKWLKTPDTAPEFTAIVRALKEDRPLPSDARPEMVRAARAILDPKLGNSGTRIAWSALWSPEAKRAGLTEACLNLGAEILGPGATKVVTEVHATHEPAFRVASGELTKLQAALGKASEPAERTAIEATIKEADGILKHCYQVSEPAGPAASSVFRAVGEARTGD